MEPAPTFYAGLTAAECVAERDRILARDAALAQAVVYRRFKYFMTHAGAHYFESQLRQMWPNYAVLFARYRVEQANSAAVYQGDPMQADERRYDAQHKGCRNSWSGD